MKYLTKPEDTKPVVNTEEKEEIDARIDVTKDYIYTDNREIIVSEYDVIYGDVTINYTSLKNIENDINQRIDSLRASVVYTKDVKLDDDIDYYTTDEGVYSASFINFETTEYDKYLAIEEITYDFDIINLTTPTAIKVYNVDKTTGEVLNDNYLLLEYGVTLDSIKEEVRATLTTLAKADNTILVEETMNDFTQYGIYVNRYGNLEIKYIVKSTNNNYYDTLIIK